MQNSALDYLVVLDFEATCDTSNPPDPQEIIEFPSVLMALPSREVVDEFEAFVRPVHHPALTDFCREFTSIQQTDVDAADTFSPVLQRHLAWLASHGLATTAGQAGPSYAFVTCGDWDLASMLPAQARVADPPLDLIPWPYRRWINIKRAFVQWHGGKSMGMAGMLRALSIELEGHHHRGIDDCRNIAKIAAALIDKDITLAVTSRLSPSRYPPLPLTLIRDGVRREATLKKRAMGSLLGLASGLYRAQALQILGPDGDEIVDDEGLCDLPSGVELTVLP